jgi:hypothetical protein
MDRSCLTVTSNFSKHLIIDICLIFSLVFTVAILCNPIDRHRRFGGTHSHLIQAHNEAGGYHEMLMAFYQTDGRVSSVGIATRYGLDGPGIESRWGARFSAPVQTGPGAYPASCIIGTESFPGARRPGRGVDHSLHPGSRLKKDDSYASSLHQSLHCLFQCQLYICRLDISECALHYCSSILHGLTARWLWQSYQDE